MFLLKARARRDTAAGFIAHSHASWGSGSPDKCSAAPRDCFIYPLYFFLFFFLNIFLDAGPLLSARRSLSKVFLMRFPCQRL